MSSTFIYVEVWFELCTSQLVRSRRINSLTPSIVTDHVSRCQAVINRFNINDPSDDFNMDKSGSLIKHIIVRSFSKPIDISKSRPCQQVKDVKGNLARVVDVLCVC